MERADTLGPLMTEKNPIQTLVEEAAASGLPLDRLRGVAFFDAEKDSRLTSLKSFGSADLAVAQIQHFVARFGAENVTRAVLQFVYQYFARVDTVRYEQAIFNTLWADFTAEIDNPQWLTRGIANVRKFTSQNLHLALEDGIAIRGRSFAELAALGIDQVILNKSPKTGMA